MIKCKFLLTFGILTATLSAQILLAQNTEGVITYEIKINMHRNLPEDRAEMKNMIPEFRTSQTQLFFNAEESLYKPVEAEPDDDAIHGGGVRMRMQRQKFETYVNAGQHVRVTLQEWMGKNYLIEDSVQIRPWKLGTETKEVNGYVCRQATMYDEGRKQDIVVWYSDKFRPFLGPDVFNTLPGGVLLIDVNDGERIITAKSIELRPLKEKEIKVPNAKIKVSEEEYRELVRKQMERMRANGGNSIIRH
jgi:GLPGLI family protein